MERFITLFALVSLCNLVASAQKKYEMIIEKTDGSKTIINVEDIIRTSVHEQVEAYTTCPDANHPHIIDLGLPSGRKWACCNVGASVPEDYGNYYAWGETEPKSRYDYQDTYQWGYYNYDDDYSHLVNIGADIAGTQYDAATANWGIPWRMPSLTHIQELLHNCTSTWTTQNGVNGCKFIGPNGGTIFLPAAGRCWYDELNNLSSEGECWSSTLDEPSPCYAHYIGFSSDYVYAYWGSLFRCAGLPVRPVR